MKFMSTNGKFFALFLIALVGLRLFLQKPPATPILGELRLQSLDGRPGPLLDEVFEGPGLMVYLDQDTHDCVRCLQECLYFAKFAEAYPVSFAVVFDDAEPMGQRLYLDALDNTWHVPGPRLIDKKGVLRDRLHLTAGHKFVLFDKNGDVFSVLPPCAEEEVRVKLYHELFSQL